MAEGLEDDPRYAMAEEIVREKIAADSSDDINILRSLSRDEVIVVSGTADHIENVFNKIHLPHTFITPEQLTSRKLTPNQTVYMNCHPTGYTPQAKENVKRFVAEGGLLITTDYVLNMLLTELFPDLLVYGGENTVDKSVAIECADDDYDEVLKAFKGESFWKLAGGSHPITIKDKNKVTVLISSKQLEKEYPGKGAVLIRFQYEQGTVYHMISHFHLQHSGAKAGNATIDAAKASDYAKEKGATQETVDKMKKMELNNNNLTYTDVQNASVTTEMAYRAAMGQKKRDNARRK